MSRAVHALDGTSEAVSTIRAAAAAHPELAEPAQLARELAVQAAERRLRATQPSLPADERRRRAERDPGPCHHSLQQIAWATGLPRVVSWQDAAGRHDGIGGDDAGALEDHCAGIDDGGLAAVDSPAGTTAAALAALTPEVGGQRMEDLLADLGLGDGDDGRPASADLPRIRRRLLAPFILPGERPQSHAVLDRAGRRARAKLVHQGQLLPGDRLAAAWREGITAEEARAVDGESA
jgi:hypothetical protein